MPGDKTVNLSAESKKNVICGICGQKGRRDNLKANHFPKKHPNKAYLEQGELSSPKIDLFKPKIVSTSNQPANSDVSMEFVNDSDINLETEENSKINTPFGNNDTQTKYDLTSNEPTISKSAIFSIKNSIREAIEPLIKTINSLKINKETENKCTNSDKEHVESVENYQILRSTTCKTIEELCIFGELSFYTNQKKLICDICDDDSNGEIKRSGEFSYD